MHIERPMEMMLSQKWAGSWGSEDEGSEGSEEPPPEREVRREPMNTGMSSRG